MEDEIRGGTDQYFGDRILTPRGTEEYKPAPALFQGEAKPTGPRWTAPQDLASRTPVPHRFIHGTS